MLFIFLAVLYHLQVKVLFGSDEIFMAVEQFGFVLLDNLIIQALVNHCLIDTMAIIGQYPKRPLMVHHGFCLHPYLVNFLFGQYNNGTPVVFGVSQQFIVVYYPVGVCSQFFLYLPVGFIRKRANLRMKVKTFFLLFEPVAFRRKGGIRCKQG